MVHFTRNLARQLRMVFRQLVGRTAAVRPVLTFHADATRLCVRLHRVPIVAEYHEPGDFGAGTLSVPFDLLSDCAGRDDGSVSLAATERTSVSASWLDHGLPQVKHYQSDDVPSEFPADTAQRSPATVGLLAALADASKIVADKSMRYALSNLQLRGGMGEIVATDGRQLLVQSAFAFPWESDLLVPSTAAYGCQELARTGDVSVARTETHVVLRAGHWTLFAPIDKQGRYPNVEDVTPRRAEVATRCRFDPADAAFLAAALPRLPGAKDEQAPVTVSLDGDVAVRARAEGNGPGTEVILARSEHSGAAVRFRVDRSYLSQALALGFDRLEIVSADAPLAFRDERRTYAFMPLGKDAALPASADAVRINSRDVNHDPMHRAGGRHP